MARDDSTQPQEGISRRSLLRKGAIVGGSLLWTTPVVQSITPPASAKVSPNGVCSCCACNEPVFPGGSRCVVDNFDPAGCAAACGAGGVNSFCRNVTPLGTCMCTSSPVTEPICVCG
jgi:hypothetical protein